MKAIIISDDSNIINALDYTLSSSGFDTIIYRWLLKALDNIEEIRPDLVIVSANEYPRHWKTLTQFIASGIGGDKTKVFLLTLNELDKDEIKKAEALGIRGFISGTNTEDMTRLTNLLSDIFNLNSKEIDCEEDDEIPTVSSLQETQPVTFDSNSVSLIFKNPKTGKIITGSVISYENKTVHFKADYPEKISMLSSGDIIDLLTFEIDSQAFNYKSEIIMNNTDLLMKLEEIHE